MCPCSQWRTISLATGGVAAQRAAQLADDAPAAAVVEVHVLARQRRAPAVDAAVAVGLQGAHAAPQQQALELLDVGGGRSHLPTGFAVPAALPASAIRAVGAARSASGFSANATG